MINADRREIGRALPGENEKRGPALPADLLPVPWPGGPRHTWPACYPVRPGPVKGPPGGRGGLLFEDIPILFEVLLCCRPVVVVTGPAVGGLDLLCIIPEPIIIPLPKNTHNRVNLLISHH